MCRVVPCSVAPVLAVAMMVSTVAACRPTSSEPLGPADSYTLFSPLPPGPGHVDGVPLVTKLALGEPQSAAIEKLFADGLAAEMLRTVYLVKQLVRDLRAGNRAFPEPAQRWASDTTYLVVGALDRDLGRGLALSGSWFGGPAARPDAVWVKLPASTTADRALVQGVTGALANMAVRVVASAGDPAAMLAARGPLIEGYRMAMEVISREWRSGRGPAGMVPPGAGTNDQRELFARVRENRFVVTADGVTPRTAGELLADPGVAATVLYRMAQTKGLAQRVAANEFYAPVADNRLPPGVSPAAALGPFRNFQIKLLGAWAKAALAGTPPRTISDLVQLYAQEHPTERAEAYRVFVITTFGATMKPGGVIGSSPDATLAELTTLATEAAAGRRPLTASPSPAAKAPPP